MKLNTQTTRTARRTSLLVTIFISLFYSPLSTQAMGNAAAFPAFQDFSKSVQNGDAAALRVIKEGPRWKIKKGNQATAKVKVKF